MTKSKKGPDENKLNHPDIPALTELEELHIDNKLLAHCLSKIKFYIPLAKEHLNDTDLEIIKKYAR